MAEGIVLALATIGPAVERKAKELTNTEQSAAALIVDAIGTVAAELTADFLESKIRQDCAGWGWKVSRRYAPGYCGWGLEGQKEIFSRFPDTIGIKLTKSCLMFPEKSLSFVCMISRKGNFDKIKLQDCKRCKQKDCPYRLHSYITES
jgi:cobalamin-dependent methionine synthase I